MRKSRRNPDALHARLFALGGRLGCHQRADRSFFLRGRQFPVCARCTGVLLGYLPAVPAFFLRGASWRAAAAGMAAMLADWLLQRLGLLESTNPRRLVTGFFGGYGIMTAQLLLARGALQLLAGAA